MTAKSLRVCSTCGRPQLAEGGTCVACGAALPEEAAPAPPDPRQALLEPYQPFLEASLGGGRVLLLSQKNLEWRVGQRAPFVTALEQIALLRFSKRPVWEALLPAALVAAPIPWVAGVARGVLAAFALLWAAAGLLQRRCALVVRTRGGAARSLDFGMGLPTSDVVRRAERVWASLAPELEGLGVRTHA